MLPRARHQQLPSSWEAREVLRDKGQFWTPAWVAEAMVVYVMAGGARNLFDPAVGAGAFFRAAKKVAASENREIRLLGTEIDRDSLSQALEGGLSSEDLCGTEIRDFVSNPPSSTFDAVVANPPYIRHHRLSERQKTFLRRLGATITGKPLDGRAGYHVYFFLRALSLLAPSGRLAFIMPADVCEGVFAPALWNWVLRNYTLDAVITFAPEATPFPSVDTNAMLFMLRKEQPRASFFWARCKTPDNPALKRWVSSSFALAGDLDFRVRTIEEGLRTGFSRLPSQRGHPEHTLGDFARVLRGVATGANDFFFLTKKRATELEIPSEFLISAVGRTRDTPSEEVAPETLRHLETAGRPTLLLSLDGRPTYKFPKPLQEYIRHGEEIGVHKSPLIATRKPWYKMEVRVPPPFLFAYLGRRNARFIRNSAGVIPLTGFLCIYPRTADPVFVERLWNILREPETLSNLSLVGKSYGAGAIKVEPRALERLPISITDIQRWDMDWQRVPKQMPLVV